MTQASEKIMQQYIDGGVIPGKLVGQDAVSKTYVDDQLEIRDEKISAAQNSANEAQRSINDHIASKTAHKAENITYTGQVPGDDVKEAINNVNGRISEIVAQSGNDNTEIVDSRGGYPVLRARLDASDAQLADRVKKGELIVNVKDYGAKGDRKTDDTEAIKAAISAINARGGGVLFFPKGTYLISSTLVLTRYSIIRGEGSHITGIFCSDGFSPMYDSAIVFRYDSNHCDGISMYDIGVQTNKQPIHGITGYSVYDSVIFQNVIVEGLNKNFSSFRFIPHEALISIDPVSQTILLMNCMGYIGEDGATAPVFYFDSVQEMNIIGCKAFSARGWPEAMTSSSTGFEFNNCRGVAMIGCSVGGSTSETYPIRIVSTSRSSGGFYIAGTTFESVDKLLFVQGAFDPIYNVNFVGSRNEGVGGNNPTVYLENVRDSNIEVMWGNSSQTNVTNSIVHNSENIQFLNDEFNLYSAGANTLLVKYPYSLGSSLFLLVNNGTDVTQRRVEFGPPDSAGAGYRTLRILN